MENLDEVWQTSVNGQIYETDFAGLVEWIAEGSLQPQDKVRKGNLRWIEANKVPALHSFFNARELESSNQIVTSTTSQNPTPTPQVQNFNTHSQQPVAQNFQAPPPPNFYKELTPEEEKQYCMIHTDANAKYHCETCGNYFCKACPKNAICLMCGATCKTLQVFTAPPPVVPQPLSEINSNQEVYIDEDVKKSANWLYWKAGLTVVNSILAMAGVYWQFFIGLTVPQLFHGVLIGIGEMSPDTNLKLFHGVVFMISLAGSGLTAFFAYKAKQAKRWAFVLGIIIYSFDGLLYLLTFSIFGILIHIFAIYALSKGYSGCKNS